jgi:hypothetical protein
MSELEELKKQNAALEERLKKLEDKEEPPPRNQSYSAPRDYTEGMSMPALAIREMVNAIPESVMREVRADAKKPNPVTGYTTPQPTNQVRGSGWRDEVPISTPPGIAHIDRLVDAQDEQDRTELARKIAQARMNKGGG